MPDVTDQILAEITPDPHFHPLSPTVGKLEDYAHDFRAELAEMMGKEHLIDSEYFPEWELVEYDKNLDYEGNHITYEWATNEILGHQMNWVRVGLVAERMRRYRIYKHKFPDWKTYCEKVLGKQAWQMKKIIKAALAVMELIRHGFPILPTCISQAQKLLDCCKKSGMLLVDAWESVLEQLPVAHLLTSNNIAEALGFPVDYSDKISKHQRKKIKELADRDGMTIDEKLEQWIEEDSEPEPEPEPEATESEELEDVEQQLWYQEMMELVQEHDHQIWFLSAIARLLKPIRKSQYSWLRNLRYQT